MKTIINPETISEKLLYSTLRIETDVGVGTGFLFSYRLSETKQLPLLITNKHVVEGSKVGSFLVHASDPDRPLIPTGKFLPVTFDDFETRWLVHPDENIDLCAMPINPLNVEIEKTGKRFFRTVLDESNIWKNEKLKDLSAVEEVVMYGYPNGLWDEANNFPIIRRGSTASHPAVDFNSSPLGVIDMGVFPGSSGSPIIIANEGVYGTRQGAVAGNRMVFLGVLFSGPTMTEEGEIIIKNIPTNKQPFARTELMIHLGYYIKSKEVLVLAESIKQIMIQHGEI